MKTKIQNVHVCDGLNCLLLFLAQDESAHATFRTVRALRSADTRSDSRKHRWEENKKSMKSTVIRECIPLTYCPFFDPGLEFICHLHCHCGEETTEIIKAAFANEVAR